MRTLKTPTVELFAQPAEDYIDVGLLSVIGKEAFGEPLILKGPKGTGKTSGIEQYCALNKIPFVRFDCNEWTNLRDLQGSMTATEDTGYAFALGCVTLALETANFSGKCMLILEEFNALTPNAQKILNGIADYRKSVAVPKVGMVFKLEKQKVAETSGKVISVDQGTGSSWIVFSDDTVQEIPGNLGITVKEGDTVKAGEPITVKPELWLVGTMNPNYSGTYQINEDMRSRFDFIEVPYMPAEMERKIMKTIFPKPTKKQKEFMDSLQVMAAETRTSQDGAKMGYAMSPRDMLKTCRRFRRTGDERYTLQVLEGKFDGEDRKNNRARIKRLFEVDLARSSNLVFNKKNVPKNK